MISIGKSGRQAQYPAPLELHRMHLEQKVAASMVDAVVARPTQAKELGEAARTAIDALLGVKPVALTEGDAQADLAGKRRPDNHID